MFKRIAIADNESPEADRALTSAIQLVKALGAELRAVTIPGTLPLTRSMPTLPSAANAILHVTC